MSLLDHYSHDGEGRNWTIRCECGERKHDNHDACPRCTFLDGTRGSALIIDALRGTDGLTANEVSRLLGNQYSEGTSRSLRRLLRLGRVRRYWRDADIRDGVGKWGRGASGQGAWVYALDARVV